MSKKISSYEELVAEKVRLQELLALQKTAISNNVSSLEEDVRPMTNGLLVMGRVLTKIGRRNRPTSPLLNVGLDIGVDMILRRWLLRKSGWLTRTVVPLLASTLMARYLGEDKQKAMLSKMRSFFGDNGPEQSAERKAAAEEKGQEPDHTDR